MTNITLYFAPDTCARVPNDCARRNWTSISRQSLVAFVRGDHRSPGYLAPQFLKGKVPGALRGTGRRPNRECRNPVLVGECLSRRSAPAETFRSARITLGSFRTLPYCASLLHPIVTRLRIPGTYFCDPPRDGIPRVFAVWPNRPMRARTLHLLTSDCRSTNGGTEIAGRSWTPISVGIWFFALLGTAFERFRPIATSLRHAGGPSGQRPAVQRALRRDTEAAKWLAERGFLEVKFSGKRCR